MERETGNFFRANRDRLGITQLELANRIGVTTGAVSGWESGKVPTIQLVDKIAAAFGCPPRKVMDAMLEMSRSRRPETLEVTAGARA